MITYKLIILHSHIQLFTGRRHARESLYLYIYDKNYKSLTHYFSHDSLKMIVFIYLLYVFKLYTSIPNI